MCTAIFDNKYGAFFGRTLDLEYSLGQEVVRTRRGSEISFLYEGKTASKFTFIGMAHKAKREINGEELPLYFDGMNERGLSVAALNFYGLACYNDKRERHRNLASFEVIPYILSTCGNLDCVRKLLMCANITSDAFSAALTPTPLHFMVADREGAIVIEQTANGLEIHENKIGVMTNSPTFDYHRTRLADYAALSPSPPKNNLCPDIDLQQYSRGLGAVGLPGDFSSSSRFIRAAFVKSHTLIPSNALFDHDEKIAARDRAFHVLSSVSVPLGCVLTDADKPVCTVYTSVCDMNELTYHYFTYADRNIRSVAL